MTRKLSVVLTGVLLGCWCLGMAADAEVALAALYEPGRWAVAECEVSRFHDVADGPVLQMLIPIDYQAGEAAYPVGWPRMSLQRRPGDPDLSAYDYLEFALEVRNTRSELDYFPLTWVVASGGRSSSRRLLPVPGAKLSVQIPVAELTDPAGWTSMGVHISESDYADGDVVAFRFSGVRLRQLGEVRVAGLRLLQPAVYPSASALSLEVALEGPAEAVDRGIPLRLSAGSRSVLELLVSLPRGRSTCTVPLGGLDLPPGAYELALLPDALERGKRVAFRVVAPFWPVPGESPVSGQGGAGRPTKMKP